MTDAQLNENVKLQPHDWFVKATLLWAFPRCIRPNHVTVFRFVASPIVFWLLWKGDYTAGLVAFVAVALTDAIDGTMARTRKQITLWGTTYDGVADKFLVSGVALLLVWQRLGLLLAGLLIALEAIEICAGLYLKYKKGIVRSALWWGKIKMNLQVFATVALLIDVIWDRPLFSEISVMIFGASFAFAIINLIAHAKREMMPTTLLPPPPARSCLAEAGGLTPLARPPREGAGGESD